MIKLSPVGRIHGVRLEQHPDIARSAAFVQYSDRIDALHELEMPLLDALYLLNLLEAMAKDAGVDHLRHGPN